MPSKSSIIVLYKTSERDDGSFNVDYYVSQHMRLVEKAWECAGIEGWQVLKFSEVEGVKPAYYASAVVTFESLEGATKALRAPDTEKVFGDVPNFTNLQPLLMSGEVHGTWTREISGA
jgi:uncharacterized protein (TIGR02118 family)